MHPDPDRGNRGDGYRLKGEGKAIADLRFLIADYPAHLPQAGTTKGVDGRIIPPLTQTDFTQQTRRYKARNANNANQAGDADKE